MYLKPTQALWNKVETKINSMFKDRLAYAADWFHYGLKKSEFEKLIILDIILPEDDVMIHKLGAKWFEQAEHITVDIPNGASSDVYNVDAKTGGRSPYVSPHWNSYGPNNRPKVMNETIRDIARRRREATQKIIDEQRAFREQVSKVWGDAPSINALAKIWPPIVDLLPPDVVAQLEKKTTRRTAKQLADNIDTKSLSVSILKAKVGQ